MRTIEYKIINLLFFLLYLIIAPEILTRRSNGEWTVRKNAKITKKYDVFAFGCALFEFIYDNPPFTSYNVNSSHECNDSNNSNASNQPIATLNFQQTYDNIQNANFTMLDWQQHVQKWNQNLFNFISLALQPDPSKRAQMQDLCSHSFVSHQNQAKMKTKMAKDEFNVAQSSVSQ